MLHKNILTLMPMKTDLPLFHSYQPTVWRLLSRQKRHMSLRSGRSTARQTLTHTLLPCEACQ